MFHILRPPKGKRKSAATSIEGSVPPQAPVRHYGSIKVSTWRFLQSLSESLSYLHLPRPFKNPYYSKNVNRRTKGLKFVLAAERERLRQGQDKAKESMEVDGEEQKTEKEDNEMPTCKSFRILLCAS